MARPTYYPEWATTDTTLPVAGTSNKSRPKESLRTIGWDKSQIPAAEELNWQLDNVYDWVVHFDTLNSISKTVNFTGDVSGSFSFSNDSSTIGNVTLTVSATSSPTADSLVKRDSTGSAEFSRVKLQEGSAASPSLFFNETSNDTGMFHPSDGEIGVALNGVFSGKFDATYGWNGNARSVSSIVGKIVVVAGTIADGATIPLPDGFTAEQVYCMVSMRDDNPSATVWELDEIANTVHSRAHCLVDSNRLVTCYTDVWNFLTTSYNRHAGTANYILIGYK